MDLWEEGEMESRNTVLRWEGCQWFYTTGNHLVERRIDDVGGRQINCRCNVFEQERKMGFCAQGKVLPLKRIMGGLPTVTRRKMVSMDT